MTNLDLGHSLRKYRKKAGKRLSNTIITCNERAGVGSSGGLGLFTV